jgi:DNA-binding CsgD family transcriptional regulator
MVGRYWKTSEIATLKALLRVRTPMPEIVRNLNRTEGSIYSARVRYLGYEAQPKVTESEVQQACAAWAAGRTIKEIAEATGRSPEKVSRMLVGVRKNREHQTRTTEIKTEQARALWAQGRTVKEIATAIGRHPVTVIRALEGVRKPGEHHAG